MRLLRHLARAGQHLQHRAHRLGGVGGLHPWRRTTRRGPPRGAGHRGLVALGLPSTRRVFVVPARGHVRI